MENTDQIGRYLESIVLQITKYGSVVSDDIIKENNLRLVNQLYKLIPMKENDEDWQKQLDTVLIEVAGLNEILIFDSHFLQVLSILEGIKLRPDIAFSAYRRAVFKAISLLSRISAVKDAYDEQT